MAGESERDLAGDRHSCRPAFRDEKREAPLHAGMEPGFWMRLQLNYEMQRARIELGRQIEAEVKPAA